MAKLSELVETLSYVLGRPVPTVTLVGRHLREDGLISSGGRGRGGAEMTVSDCVNLLLGVVCSEQAKEAPQAVRAYRSARNTDQKMSARKATGWSKTWMFIAKPEVELGAVLEGLVEGFANGILGRALLEHGGGVEMSAKNPGATDIAVLLAICARSSMGVNIEFNSLTGMTRITVTDNSAHSPLFSSMFSINNEQSWTVRPKGDLSERKSISTMTFLYIGSLLQRTQKSEQWETSEGAFS